MPRRRGPNPQVAERTGGTGDYMGASGTCSSPNNEEGNTVTTVMIYVPKD